MGQTTYNKDNQAMKALWNRASVGLHATKDGKWQMHHKVKTKDDQRKNLKKKKREEKKKIKQCVRKKSLRVKCKGERRIVTEILLNTETMLAEKTERMRRAMESTTPK